MKSVRLVFALATLAAPSLAPVHLAAQGSRSAAGARYSDVSVAVRFGTLGLGLEVGKLLTNHVSARIGANYLSFNTSRTTKGIDYTVAAKLQAVTGLLDLYPASRGSFHFTAGVITDPLKVTATGVPNGSTFTINGHSYTAAQVGTLTGAFKFPSARPYLGLGFGTPARRGGAFGFFFDLGAGLGKPDVTLNATGATAGSALDADLQAQIATTRTDVAKLKFYPVLSFGLAVRF